MIWRRLLVKSDSTIEDLHYTLQIAIGREDIHLYHFIIHGKQYGITQLDGIIGGGNIAKTLLANSEKTHVGYSRDTSKTGHDMREMFSTARGEMLGDRSY